MSVLAQHPENARNSVGFAQKRHSMTFARSYTGEGLRLWELAGRAVPLLSRSTAHCSCDGLERVESRQGDSWVILVASRALALAANDLTAASVLPGSDGLGPSAEAVHVQRRTQSAFALVG